MSIAFEERLSDSPYVERVMHGWTLSDGSPIRPAESHWHLVFTRMKGTVHTFFVGALPTSGVTSYLEGAEILWIKFKLGTFMPHLPIKQYLNSEIPLPVGAGGSFWLKGAAMPFPNYDNVESFVNRLVRDDVLVRDPLISAALNGEPPRIPERTLRHRFLRATGMTQSQIRQIERAQRAAAMLREGSSILDTVDALGYYDQPHLTRSLKRFVGTTPKQQLIRQPHYE